MKKIMMATIVVAISVVSGWNISQNKSEVALADVALANVEALAYELPEVTITCGQFGGACWKSYPEGCRFTGSQSNFCVYG